MFYVGVCDDELAVCEQVREYLLEFAKVRGVELDIAVYCDGKEVWQQLEAGKRLQLLFLDIQMAFLDGLELGKRIRGELNDQLLQIVYISGKQQYAMELFQVRPMNFLVKPLESEKLISQLELAMKLCKEQEASYFFYQIERNYGKIAYADILYFESRQRKLRIVTLDKDVECYGTLCHVVQQVPSAYFIQIHKSYLVNEMYVSKWHAEQVLMQNGDWLRISRSFRKRANNKLLEMNKYRRM